MRRDRTKLRVAVCAVLAVLLSGCLLARREVKLPDDDEATAMVLSMTLNEPMEKIATHPWFAVRDKGETVWERWEIGGYYGEWGYLHRAVGDPLSGDNVRLHGQLRGEEASRFIKCLRREAPNYEYKHLYRAWPGPNSNTYVDVMLRRCNFHAELPSTAIGKDYRGLIGASFTAGGTGVQIETPLLGFKIGLTEGIQLHVMGFTIGVDFWPPAIIYPIGDGRIGFDDR